MRIFKETRLHIFISLTSMITKNIIVRYRQAQAYNSICNVTFITVTSKINIDKDIVQAISSKLMVWKHMLLESDANKTVYDVNMFRVAWTPND